MQDTPDESGAADTAPETPVKPKWWQYTPYWLKPLAKGHVSRDMLQARIGRIEDVHQATKQRFELIVAVANGAALAACGSKVLDALTKAPTPESVALVKLLFPSLICFVIGLTAVGIGAAARIYMMEVRMSQLNSILIRTPVGETVPVTVRWTNPNKFWMLWIPELIAGAGFFNGVLFPMIDIVEGATGKGAWTW